MRKPPYVHGFVDRHGRVRHYFRRPDHKQVPLPGLPWSPEFMAAYEAAMKCETAPRIEPGAWRTIPGTINALVVAYYNSLQFQGLTRTSQIDYRRLIERFRREHGHRSIAGLTRAKVTEMLGNRARTPAAARNWLRMLRTLMRFAVDQGLRADDPTAGIKSKYKSDGFLPWGEDQIAQYRARHPIGTRARIALELLLNVGPRRGDVVQLGRQHIRDGRFYFRTQKTATLVEGIPVLADLQEALDAMPREHLTFLVTEYGKPFTAAGFGGWFHERCTEAGLPKGYTAHGLRKAAATRLADLGATAHQLMATFGWTTLREAERYTRAADRKRLAQSAGELLIAGTSSGKPKGKVSQKGP
jgi:integrase